MKRIVPIMLSSVFLLTTGCTPVNKTNDKEIKSETKDSQKKSDKNSSVNTSVDRKHDFTYLEQLPKDKLETYNQFLEDGNLDHLTDFTPEQIVLLYMNLVLKHETDKIYALTYNNGQLPSLDRFKDEYDHYLSEYLNEDYLAYRFYDSISVDEETRKKDSLVVQIKITYGTTTRVVNYGLKREQNVWKLDLYHLVKDSKKRAKKCEEAGS
ncbi:hypothetical protein [Aneurinibacillus uraniidurans]|uniref:hypothetical protein n=1 Tax=Aneurinibacillus uraniidurans TaxID=2966586 RepID=UPI0023496706|nr:hypothetical protein [Aneurinibacillus sp. B1]WCN36343.1 hypothetical protein PO771_10625 [Aneurinibacillus sp. B1]